MSPWRPCKRRVFIKRVKKLGFEGPFSVTRHQFMIKDNHRLSIPTHEEYSVPQLRMMIREVESIINRTLDADEWNHLA